MNRIKPGKKTKEWDRARAQIKPIFEHAEITCCEMCGSTWKLGFAHSKKRIRIAPDGELRWDEIREVALLCVACHEKIEGIPAMHAIVTRIIELRIKRLEMEGFEWDLHIERLKSSEIDLLMEERS